MGTFNFSLHELKKKRAFPQYSAFYTVGYNDSYSSTSAVFSLLLMYLDKTTMFSRLIGSLVFKRKLSSFANSDSFHYFMTIIKSLTSNPDVLILMLERCHLADGTPPPCQ